MAIIRINKVKDFTTISNHILTDRRISLKAKGLLVFMLSFSNDWKFSVSGIAALLPDSKTSITNSLKELKESGYLIVRKVNPNESTNGRYDYIYDVYEEPQKQGGKKQGIEKQDLEFQDLEKQDLEFQDLEKQGIENESLTNTNKTNTNKTNTKRVLNTKKTKGRFVPPTLDELKDYVWEKQLNVDPEDFINHFTANGWKVGGKAPMKDWKAAAQSWSSRQTKWQKENKSNGNNVNDVLQAIMEGREP